MKGLLHLAQNKTHGQESIKKSCTNESSLPSVAGGGAACRAGGIVKTNAI